MDFKFQNCVVLCLYNFDFEKARDRHTYQKSYCKFLKFQVIKKIIFVKSTITKTHVQAILKANYALINKTS